MADFVIRNLGPLQLEVHRDRIVLSVIGSSENLTSRLALDELALFDAELDAKGVPHEVCLKNIPESKEQEPDRLVFRLQE